ncbi:MAG: hypothetical protein JRI68_16120 [Deltaproteobacteria bacterium]|nr:hypothetical protein [Deltaproteobacteria bacterium]
MKTSFIALLVVPFALFITGCGDACDDLADKLEGCDGFDTSTVQTDDCTDAQLTCAECLEGCLDDDCGNLMDCAVDCQSDCTA